MFCSNTPSNKPFHRLLDERGSAVVLVISVGALVTLLVFTWIAFSVIRSHKSLSAGNILRARYAAESVISKAVFRQMTGSFGEEKLVVNADDAKPASRNAAVIDAADQGNTVTYTDSLHHSSGEALVTDEGSFLRVQASGTAGKTRCAVDARFGREVSDAFRFALILSEQNRQLEIRRGAVIGDVQLAQRPLGAVSGNVETGIAALPPVNRGKFSMALRELQDMLHASADTVMQGSQVFDVNHWLSVTAGKSLFVNGNVLVQGATRGARNARTITGPWTLIASGDIQISGSVNLDNVGIFSLGTVKCFDNVRLSEVTVYAKNTIDLEDQVRCSGTLFAMENLLLSGTAEVLMPSFAYVNGNTASGRAINRCGIQLTQKSRFAGTVFCEDATTFSLIERNARFTGVFYTRGSLALEGTVHGCVAAQMLRKDILSDKNELAGGVIDRRMLPKSFVLPVAFGGPSARFKLVSWVENSVRDGKKGSDE